MSTTFGTIEKIQFLTNRNCFNEIESCVRSPSIDFSTFHSSKKCIKNCDKREKTLSDNSVIDDKHRSNGLLSNEIIPCISNGVNIPSSQSKCDFTDSQNDQQLETQNRFLNIPGLNVEESKNGAIRFATNSPHLVSTGSGRLSVSVTLHPINEGRTILGSGGMGVIPDIVVIGTGVEPEHCLLENSDGEVFMTPLATMVAIDGMKISDRTKLTQGCMISLGRSHFFRFNHPAEANLMKSILPNARISMPPVSFYPAVDNPEYFHMSPEERQILSCGNTSAVDEDGADVAERVEDIKPSFPPRKTPPNTLRLSSKYGDLISPSNGEEDENGSNNQLVNGHTSNLDEVTNDSKSSPQSSVEISDSDTPPEIPPRSGSNGLPSYANVIVANSSNFVGDYICTKGDSDVEINCNKETMPSESDLSPDIVKGPTAVINSNGLTSVHNALYRSLPSDDRHQQSSPIFSSLSPSIPQEHIYQHPPPPVSVVTISTVPIMSPLSSYYSIPKTPVAISSFQSPNCKTSQADASKMYECKRDSLSLYSFSPVSSPEPIGRFALSSNLNSVTSVGNTFRNGDGINLSNCQRNVSLNYDVPPSLLPINTGYISSPPLSSCNQIPIQQSPNSLLQCENMKLKAYEDRIREEAVSEAETLRLEEIINMCAEYERQNSGGGGSSSHCTASVSSPKSPSSPCHTLTQNRIKTNGSLPRDKRSPLVNSPSQLLNGPVSVSSSTDENMKSEFQYDVDLNGLREEDLCSYPPFPNSPMDCSSSPPPLSPRSPYENVPLSHSGHAKYSITHSPRTRIKTTFREKRDHHCEVFENKLAIVSEQDKGVERTCKEVYSPKILSPVSRLMDDDVPSKPPRSPRIDRKILDLDSSVFANRGFVDVTPKSKNSSTSINPRNPHFVASKNQQSSTRSDKASLSSSNVDANRLRNKVLTEQIMRNIHDSLDIKNIAGEVVKLKEEQNRVIKETSVLKTKIMELESLETEALRELDMERALIEGELICTGQILKADQEKLNNLLKQSKEMEERHGQENLKDESTINECKQRLAAAESEIDSIGSKRQNESSNSSNSNNNDNNESESLNVTSDSFQELLESERKNFEDAEFSHMESKALRESEREELNQEILDVQQKISAALSKIKDLKNQKTAIVSNMKKDAFSLEEERQRLIARIKKEFVHASDVEHQLAEFTRLGIFPPMSTGRFSPTMSSDTDESYNSDLTDQMAKLLLTEKAQENVDRSHQVTNTLVTSHGNSLDQPKASEVILETDGSHQLSCVDEGTAVVVDKNSKTDEECSIGHASTECQRIKGIERKQTNSISLNSCGSDVSTPTSSDAPVESISSGEVNGAQSSGDSFVKMRPNNSSSPVSNFRPLSEVSSMCDSEGRPIKLRNNRKLSTQQRPLTQYLPVRSEEHFDLRQHILSAGHQIELCPYVMLDQTSCKGYLHKQGSKIKTWRKRWFVFDRCQRAFMYFSDKNQSKVKGGTYFKSIEDVYVDHLHCVKNHSPKLTFCVKTHERIFHLLASSPESMRIWIDVIFTGAEGYREFPGGS